MSLSPVFAARVTEQGKVIINDRPAFDQAALAWRGKPVELVLRKPKSQRSNQANRYYFGVCIALIAEHLGYNVDEAHEAIAWHLLQIQEGDVRLPRRKSTAELSVEEFTEYVNRVKQFAAEELGVYIPDSDKVEIG